MSTKFFFIATVIYAAGPALHVAASSSTSCLPNPLASPVSASQLPRGRSPSAGQDCLLVIISVWLDQFSLPPYHDHLYNHLRYRLSFLVSALSGTFIFTVAYRRLFRLLVNPTSSPHTYNHYICSTRLSHYAASHHGQGTPRPSTDQPGSLLGSHRPDLQRRLGCRQQSRRCHIGSFEDTAFHPHRVHHRWTRCRRSWSVLALLMLKAQEARQGDAREVRAPPDRPIDKGSGDSPRFHRCTCRQAFFASAWRIQQRMGREQSRAQLQLCRFQR